MISIKNKKVLITGAGGFIGSHLTERLLNHGAKITALARYTSSGKAGWLDYIPESKKNKLKIVLGDIRDPDICAEAVKGNDFVFHLAAQIAIPYSYIAPRDFVAVNALGTANILQAARAEDVKKFLHVSTSEVYGNAQYVPMDEKHRQTAQSPYAASKIAADKIVESFHLSYNLPTVTVRPFNCYGPRQSARAIVPTIILQALRSKTIHLGNVNTCRDLNYVTDIADGMISACMSTNTTGMTLNLAGGIDCAIKAIVETISDILGKNLSIKIDKRRKRPAKSEVLKLNGDSTLANRIIGYKSKHSIKSGLQKTIGFYEQNIDKFSKEDYQI